MPAYLTVAKMILPMTDNYGNSTADAVEAVKDEILKSFGGWTAYPVQGAWRDETTGKVYHDQSLMIEVAGDWNANFSKVTMKAIAGRAAYTLDQECIYLEMAGKVAFVKPVKPMAEAA